MHQLIQISPLQKIDTPINGYPAIRKVGDPSSWTAPEGYKYVPVTDRPEYDPLTQKVERELTTEKWGWKVVDLTEEEIAARTPIPETTKLNIMKKLSALDKWSTFKTAMSQMPEEVQDAWDLATSIRGDDPLFVNYKDQFKTILDLTEEQFNSLFE